MLHAKRARATFSTNTKRPGGGRTSFGLAASEAHRWCLPKIVAACAPFGLRSAGALHPVKPRLGLAPPCRVQVG